MWPFRRKHKFVFQEVGDASIGGMMFSRYWECKRCKKRLTVIEHWDGKYVAEKCVV